MNQKRILLSEIVTDAGTQVRVQPDDATVADYAQHMTDGATFPPIVLFHDGSAYYLADGFHRVLAARRNDWRDIDADVRVGTKTDALWFALAANKANGRRLTEADKKHAITLALQAWPDRSARQIAEQVGASQDYVNDIRRKTQVSDSRQLYVTGKDGKQYAASREAAVEIKDERRRVIAEAIDSGKSAKSICEELKVRGEEVASVRRDMGRGIDNSRVAVAQRRKDITDLAARGFSTRQIADSLGIGTDAVTSTAKKEGIVIHADRVVAGTRRIDANRVVEQTVMDAENLTADVDLVAFDELNPEKLGAWIESLKKSQRALGEFVKRLIKEQAKHGKAA